MSHHTASKLIFFLVLILCIFFAGYMYKNRKPNVEHTIVPKTTLHSQISTHSNPVTHYTFSSGDAIDVSDSRNDGTIVGAKQSLPNYQGQAILLDGNSYVLAKTSFSSSTGMTISAWMYPTDTTGTTGIFSFGYDRGSGQGMTLSLDSLSRIKVTVNSQSFATGISSIDANNWYLVDFVWDGQNSSVYVNGIMKAGPTLTPLTLGTNEIRFGSVTGMTGLRGGLADVRVYDRALSADEISSQYVNNAALYITDAANFSIPTSVAPAEVTPAVVYPTKVHPSAVAPTDTVAKVPTSPKFVFRNTMKIGTRSPEVKALQIFLNTHGFVIATHGNGSLGLESMYYGTSTAIAVAKFQMAHAQEILAPYGLNKGTGNFSAKTMAVVNSLL